MLKYVEIDQAVNVDIFEVPAYQYITGIDVLAPVEEYPDAHTEGVVQHEFDIVIVFV